MPTLRTSQAGHEYTLVQSNKGLRVEYEGREVYRHWPDEPPVEGIHVSDSAELATAMQSAPDGATFVLGPGSYSVAFDPSRGFRFLARNPYRITETKIH